MLVHQSEFDHASPILYADIATADHVRPAAGKHRGHLFIRGEIIRVVPEADMVAAVVEEAERLVEEGIEARLAAADENAPAEAEADRAALLEARGDANHDAERVELVRRAAAGSEEATRTTGQ